MPTRDEYAQAVADAVRCLEDLGFTASSSETFDGSFGISVGTPDGDAEGNSDRIDAAYQECTDRYLNELQTAYLDSIRPSPEEAQAITLRCLADAGLVDDIDVPDDELDALYAELDDEPAFAECLDLPYRNPDLTPDG